MFPAMVRKSVSLRWSEEEWFVARVFYKHCAPTGRDPQLEKFAKRTKLADPVVYAALQPPATL
jgi:hypothetical protein